ncbi:MAG: hypothetical protein ACXWV1_00880 [Chitinophagaceae bacterium]
MLIVIPLFVLVGWQFDLIFFKTVALPPVAMNPLTAICFILLVFSLGLFRRGTLIKAAYILAALVLVTGLIKFSDLFLAYGTPVDTLLYTDNLLKEMAASPLITWRR